MVEITVRLTFNVRNTPQFNIEPRARNVNEHLAYPAFLAEVREAVLISPRK